MQTLLTSPAAEAADPASAAAALELAALLAGDKPAYSLREFLILLDGLPISTLHQLEAEGRGPEWFFIGRRKYLTRKAMLRWYRELEQAATPARVKPGPKPRPRTALASTGAKARKGAKNARGSVAHAGSAAPGGQDASL